MNWVCVCWNKEGKVLCVNEAASMILNVEDVVGHSFTELFPYEDADILLQGHRDFFAKGLGILYRIWPDDFKVMWQRTRTRGWTGFTLDAVGKSG